MFRWCKRCRKIGIKSFIAFLHTQEYRSLVLIWMISGSQLVTRIVKTHFVSFLWWKGVCCLIPNLKLITSKTCYFSNNYGSCLQTVTLCQTHLLFHYTQQHYPTVPIPSYLFHFHFHFHFPISYLIIIYSRLVIVNLFRLFIFDCSISIY